MTQTNHQKIWRSLGGLKDELAAMVEKDPEQDVRGMAVPVVDAVLEEAKAFIGDDAVVARVQDVLGAEVFDGYVRALDLLVVVRILIERVGRPPIGVVQVDGPPWGRSW